MLDKKSKFVRTSSVNAGFIFTVFSSHDTTAVWPASADDTNAFQQPCKQNDILRLIMVIKTMVMYYTVTISEILPCLRDRHMFRISIPA